MQVTRSIRQLIGESAVYGVSGALGRLIAFFLIPVYTRVFTPADLGTIALIDATIALATMLAVLGQDNASARWFYDSPQDEVRRETIASSFWCQLAAAGVVAGLLIALAVPVSRLLCGSGEHADLVRLAAGVMPLGVAIRVFGGWLRYRRKAPAAAVFATFRTLLTVGLVILFVVVWYRGMTGLYTARILAAGLSAAVGVVLLGTWIDPRRVRWSRLSQMLAFGLPLVPAAIAAWIMTSADRFVLRIFWPQEVVGLYDLAAKVASGVALAIFAFQQAWGPFAYSIMEKDEARRVYARVLDVYAFFGCWLAAAIGLFAPLLLRVMATEQFYPAASCVAILAFVHLFIGARYIAGLGSGIAKRSAPVAVAVAIGAGVNLLLNFLLVPYWGR
ncbi:MAG: oligosaccharide flippase family protein, partial [Planctomycetota bacterium]|nr:oligosaccharide flippase family protein [Planctomycetota bacterium]